MYVYFCRERRYYYNVLILQFFKLHTVDKLGVLSESKFIGAIKDIAERSCIEAKPVGILTGNDRNTWAEDYNLLLGLLLVLFHLPL